MSTMNLTGVLVFSERRSNYSIMRSSMVPFGTGLLILLDCHKLNTDLSETIYDLLAFINRPMLAKGRCVVGGIASVSVCRRGQACLSSQTREGMLIRTSSSMSSCRVILSSMTTIASNSPKISRASLSDRTNRTSRFTVNGTSFSSEHA